MGPITDLDELLRSLAPVLNPGTYVFATLPAGQAPDPALAVASVREPEGLSVVMEEAAARQAGLAPQFRCAWITLQVNSALHAVGLTAAVSAALAGAGISCNVVAGARHDHLFVPAPLAGAALRALAALQAGERDA